MIQLIVSSISKKILISSIAIFFLAGCGYTFQGSGSILPPDVKRVYIPLVENNSTQSGLTTVFTEALRDRFERYGVVTVVDDIGEADAVLKTRILKILRSTGAVNGSNDSAIQLDAKMVLASELRRVTGAILWKNSDFEVSQTYGSVNQTVVTSSSDFAASGLDQANFSALGQNGSREIQRGQERDVLQQLAEQAASKIYDAAVAPDF